MSKNLRQRAGVVVAAFRLDQGVQLRFVARNRCDLYVLGHKALRQRHLWDLRTDRWQPQIVRNGSAQRPLPTAFMPLPGFAVSADGAVTELQGTLMADLAGLPAVGHRKNRRAPEREKRLVPTTAESKQPATG